MASGDYFIVYKDDNRSCFLIVTITFSGKRCANAGQGLHRATLFRGKIKVTLHCVVQLTEKIQIIVILPLPKQILHPAIALFQDNRNRF